MAEKRYKYKKINLNPNSPMAFNRLDNLFAVLAMFALNALNSLLKEYLANLPVRQGYW